MLVRRVVARDDAALAVLYDRHSPLVYKLVVAVVGGSADAEEVAADVFVQLWEQADRFDSDRASVRGWLAMIARSRALDHVRTRARRSQAAVRAAEQNPEGVAVEVSGVEPTDRRSQLGRIREFLSEALGDLSADQRRAIELAYFGGLSQSEIAERLGEPLGTIKTRIRDGMARLRERVARSEARA